MFSKLEAGMWPNPDAVAGKVKRICEGVEPASPERVPPQPIREAAPAIVPKRSSPPRRPQASPSRPLASAEKSPTARKAPTVPKSSNKDLFAQKPKAPAAPKKEEAKKPVGEKPEVGRYGRGTEDSREERPITPAEASRKRVPEPSAKQVEPQKSSTPVAPSPALSHPSHRAETPADYKEEFEEETKTPEPKAPTPEPEVAAHPQKPESPQDKEAEESQGKAEDADQEEPPPHRQEEPHSREKSPAEDPKEPDMQASEPSALEPEVPSKEPEPLTREPDSPTKEPEMPTKEPDLPAAESPTQDPPEPDNPRMAESRGRDDEEDLDELFPEQEISQEVEFTLSLHSPGSVDQPYTNHSSAPEEVSVKSSNPGLAKIKNPHLTVSPGDTVNLEVEVAAGELEMAKSCVLYVSVNGKVKECIKLNVIYTSLEITQSEPRSKAETPAMDHTEPAADAPEEQSQQAADSALPSEEPPAFSPPAVADSEPPAESEPPAADVQSYEMSLPVGAKSSKVSPK